MKTKIFVVSLFLLVVTMALTGCSDETKWSAGKNLKAAQQVAKEFLTIRGYEIPKDYEISYGNTAHTEFTVRKEDFSATFNTKAEVISMEYAGKKIVATQIQTMQQMVQEFLSTTSYLPDSNYTIQYKGKDKKLVEVTEEKSQVTITFDISKEEIKVDDISFIVSVQVRDIVFGIIIAILIIIVVSRILEPILTCDSSRPKIFKKVG